MLYLEEPFASDDVAVNFHHTADENIARLCLNGEVVEGDCLAFRVLEFYAAGVVYLPKGAVEVQYAPGNWETDAGLRCIQASRWHVFNAHAGNIKRTQQIVGKIETASPREGLYLNTGGCTGICSRNPECNE